MPWVKRSAEEVEALPKPSVWPWVGGTFSVFIIFLGANTKLGFKKIPWGFDPISWNEFWEKIPNDLFGAAFITVAMYFLLIRKINSPGNNWMCDSCEATKAKDGVLVCSCGGKYFPIENFKWVEEKDGDGTERKGEH